MADSIRLWVVEWVGVLVVGWVGVWVEKSPQIIKQNQTISISSRGIPFLLIQHPQVWW